MREIKFRVWDVKRIKMNYELVWGWYADGSNGPGLIDGYAPNHEDVILMQYTGLKDKNGKEIYEGDIVRFMYKNRCLEVVEWLEGGAGFNPFTDPDDMDDAYSVPQAIDCEIIGNIYENPELLHSDIKDS